jgi:hypothetical protein
VPPHWEELVTSLAAIPIYTEKQVGTWQLFSDIQADNGDFSGKQHFFPTTSNQAREGLVTFADKVAQNDTVIVCQQPIPEIQILGKC